MWRGCIQRSQSGKLQCVVTRMPDSDEPHRRSASDDQWAHIDELKRIGQRYLDETAHHYPTHSGLPVAHYENLKEPPAMATKGDRRCGSKAQIDNNLTLDASGWSQVICGRLAGHTRLHLAPTGEKTMLGLGRRWKMAAWADSGGESECKPLGKDRPWGCPYSPGVAALRRNEVAVLVALQRMSDSCRERELGGSVQICHGGFGFREA